MLNKNSDAVNPARMSAHSFLFGAGQVLSKPPYRALEPTRACAVQTRTLIVQFLCRRIEIVRLLYQLISVVDICKCIGLVIISSGIAINVVLGFIFFFTFERNYIEVVHIRSVFALSIKSSRVLENRKPQGIGFGYRRGS